MCRPTDDSFVKRSSARIINKSKSSVKESKDVLPFFKGFPLSLFRDVVYFCNGKG